jgi:formylglycine-generating enzyme required for sulfatase activity
MTDCGPEREDCCASEQVAGGTYSRTYTNDGGGPTGEADPAVVSSFLLDKYLVTVGRFRQFVQAWNSGAATPVAGAGKHTHLNAGQGLAAVGAAPAGDGGGAGAYEGGWDVTWNTPANIDPTSFNLVKNCEPYSTYTDTAGSQEDLPINCVTWYEAYAFCIWDGGFLPSEAELEYAAAGGGGSSGQRAFPWGSAPMGTANEYAIYGCYYPDGSGTCSGVTNIAPVGTAPNGAGAWGQLDLAGEVWAWAVDVYDATYVDPCSDCAYLGSGPFRTVRGGYFSTGFTAYWRPWTRYFFGPNQRTGANGIRCARRP